MVNATIEAAGTQIYVETPSRGQTRKLLRVERRLRALDPV
jgi:hypothetical protein